MGRQVRCRGKQDGWMLRMVGTSTSGSSHQEGTQPLGHNEESGNPRRVLLPSHIEKSLIPGMDRLILRDVKIAGSNGVQHAAGLKPHYCLLENSRDSDAAQIFTQWFQF